MSEKLPIYNDGQGGSIVGFADTTPKDAEFVTGMTIIPSSIPVAGQKVRLKSSRIATILRVTDTAANLVVVNGPKNSGELAIAIRAPKTPSTTTLYQWWESPPK